ncbi:MAG: NAD(P)-dependent glycerol-3-phosphate dehydrogenase [Phycisphaerales bacterium]|nr:NAD(P)-dependent glycerol-3-phosphate dehydrogenase [Phycisphaerales bacterium]
MPPTPSSPPPPPSPGKRRPQTGENPKIKGGDSKTPRRQIAVLGIGQMGLVCAGLLDARGDADVVLWGHSVSEAGELTQMRRSDRLPGFTLPDRVRVSADLKKTLATADLVVSAIPVQFTRDVWKAARKTKLPPLAGVISVSKGIENGTLLRPTQLIAEALGDDPDARPRPIGVLSGPTIAAELARGLPATMIAASDAPGFAATIQDLFATSYLRIYTNDDVIGVELAGAMKNVIAIAAGIIDGLQAGYNAKSALLARGLAELARLGTAMGASTETFFGIAGVGDLATTCFSPEGRNRTLGEQLGRGLSLKKALKDSPFVVEGVATSRSVVALSKKYKVDMPISQSVHAVLFEGLDPIDGIGRLMSREKKAERVG